MTGAGAHPPTMPPPLVTAIADPRLAAVVVSRVPLRYRDGADPSLDRPAHVRAGSSLAWVPGGIALVQDDANFIAVADPRDGGLAHYVTLPAGVAGRRQFGDRDGNKGDKLDLEACVSLHDGRGALLLALGSGSTSRREHVALVRGWESDRPSVTMCHAAALYAALRAASAFSGSELNVEGAVFLDNRLRLFGRGNGERRGDVLPVNATCDLAWPALLAYLEAPARTEPPAPAAIVRYALGALGGVAAGFTDAAVRRDGTILFTMTAEDSPDAVRDGRVTGSALGVIDRSGAARWAAITDGSGALAAAKVEGVLPAPGRDDRAYIVVDSDDPDEASLLCEVALRGDWG